MSLLTIAQSVSNRLGLSVISSVISSAGATERQILEMINTTGKKVRDEYRWPQLIKTGTITLAASTSAYALPPDFLRFIANTHWSSNDHWPLLGPLTPEDWETYQHGLASTSMFRKYRVMGNSTAQFQVYPTPSSSDTGKVLAFEYQTTNWIIPKTWTATTSFPASSYSFYNGNIYQNLGGTTTGSTPPTHTSGTISDGGVQWKFVTIPYETALADTDTSAIDEEVIKLGAIIGFLKSKSMNYAPYERDYVSRKKEAFVKINGMADLPLTRVNRGYLLNWDNVPWTGYG